MSAAAFGRARGYMAHQRGWAALAHVSGGLAGALYAVWMILLVLFVELLLSGTQYHPQGEAAEYARRISPVPEQFAEVVYHDSGILSAVVATRDWRIGPWMAEVHAKWPWTRRSVSYLGGLMVLALAVGLLRAILLYAQRMGLAEAVSDARTRLQRDLFHHRFDVHSESMEVANSSPIAPLLGQELPLIQRGLESWLDIIARESTKAALLLAIVLALNPYLGITFVLLAAVLWIVGTWAVTRILARRRALGADADAQLRRILAMSGTLRLIKGYAADAFFRDRIDQLLARFHQDTRRQLRYEARLVPYWQVAGLILAVVILVLGAQNVLTEKFALSAAVGVCSALVSLVVPVNHLFRAFADVRKAGKAAERVFAVIDQPGERGPADGSNFLAPLATAIEIEKVTYRDTAGKPLINDLSIRIHSGQRIALIGRNPLETRALAYLLARFVEPTRGRIRFDGVDIREATLESLRSQVCLVLQGDLLFPDTVANNIGLGDPGFSLPRIIEAAKIAHAHHFVQKLPRGYDCVIGEEGFPLRPGEAYRIGLARAILRDPPIVILEEPREPLDEDTKAALDDTMNRFFPGRTVIVMPHRLSTIRGCEQIFLFDEGRMVSCGSHRELLETSELYRHLQYTEFHHPGSFAS